MLVRPQPNEDNPLWKYFSHNEGRIIHKWHHYFDIYHNHFCRFRNLPVTILEIGVFKGGSLQMWKNYFGPAARIYGVDIDAQCKELEEEQVRIFIGDQADRIFLQKLKDKIGPIDILIDDGGHTMTQQIATFEELYPAVRENGVYLIEDLHTSYWEEYGGGYKKQGSFIEYAKEFIDDINAWHSHDPKLIPGNLTKSATGIHFYDSVLVIEKYSNPEKPKVSMNGQGLDIQVNKAEIHDSPHNGPAYLYLDLMKKSLTDLIYAQAHEKFNLQGQPYDEHRRVEGMEWTLRAHTMIGMKRLDNIQFCVEDVIQRQIPGDLIETGVWRGGATIFIRAILKAYDITDRNVWVADSFEGLPPPNPDEYPVDKDDKHHESKELAVSLEQVQSNFAKYNLLDNQVMFLKGWFRDTLSTAPIEKLSILRLDGDMYESTMEALNALYPKLSVGGYLIVDDYGAIPSCKKAIHDYREKYQILDEIIPIDWTGVFWKKLI